MAAEALALHIEGMIEDGEVVPEPSNLDALENDPNMRGAVAVLVSVEPAPEKTVRINITARKSQLDAIDRLADIAGMTRSAYMVQSALSRFALNSTKARQRTASRRGIVRERSGDARYTVASLDYQVADFGIRRSRGGFGSALASLRRRYFYKLAQLDAEFADCEAHVLVWNWIELG